MIERLDGELQSRHTQGYKRGEEKRGEMNGGGGPALVLGSRRVKENHQDGRAELCCSSPVRSPLSLPANQCPSIVIGSTALINYGVETQASPFYAVRFKPALVTSLHLDILLNISPNCPTNPRRDVRYLLQDQGLISTWGHLEHRNRIRNIYSLFLYTNFKLSKFLQLY